jgi:hypothetical protein
VAGHADPSRHNDQVAVMILILHLEVFMIPILHPEVFIILILQGGSCSLQ